MTRQQSYRQRLNRFAKSYVVMDLRDPSETRLARAMAYERRYKTAGRPSWYSIGPHPFALFGCLFERMIAEERHHWLEVLAAMHSTGRPNVSD